MFKAAITCFVSVIGLCAPIVVHARNVETVAPAASVVDSAKIDKIMAEAQFAGTVLIAKGDQIVFEKAYGMVEPGGNAPHSLGKMWRWASVSKQIASTIAMQEVAAGRLGLDRPIAGCDGDGVRIIERRGFIGGIVLRNIILPDLDMVVIMTSNRSGAEAAFAEIWQQAGITYDVLAAAACPAPAALPKRILD